MKRLSIAINPDLHKRAKMLALMDEQTLSGLVIQLLNDYVVRKESGNGGHRRRASDVLRTIDGCLDRGAERRMDRCIDQAPVQIKAI